MRWDVSRLAYSVDKFIPEIGYLKPVMKLTEILLIYHFNFHVFWIFER